MRPSPAATGTPGWQPGCWSTSWLPAASTSAWRRSRPRQPHARPVPPNPKRRYTRLDDALRLATHNVTISAELYRRLEVLEQRIAEIHAANPGGPGPAAAMHLSDEGTAPAHPPPPGGGRAAASQTPGTTTSSSALASARARPIPLLALAAACWLLLTLLAVTLVVIQRPKPVHPLLPPPTARLLVPPAELPPWPRTHREKPADAS